MKELLEYIVSQLVDHPEEVSVAERAEGEDVVLEVKVAPSDTGKIIGRQGRIARAIRTVMKAAAVRDGRRVTVDILD
ncbi:MAG TPA: KH domain-containing protein [Firmicutes bacterium]|nr:KH domain-containing protein [Bacillota bacterium]